MASHTTSPNSQHVSAPVGDPSFNAEPISDLSFNAEPTLNVTIGRRCNSTSTAPSSVTHVDVDLGPLKTVSRLHARIEYDEEEGRFVIVVLGRNGAWVDGTWCGKGNKAPLSEHSQIQIASRTFHFVLPPAPGNS
ncbi:hypothetical protein BJV77DRAFT_1070103 [Russula vinacea]|nr:hypothetical protein BJV77DRAFT_1070103 [Russula vinacea]